MLRTVFPQPPADLSLDELQAEAIPEHIAVIMDGNGRWARSRGLVRALGHKAGIKAVRELIRSANDIGVRYLTIFSFSAENWTRPAAEVRTLMNLFAQTLSAELKPLYEEGVRILTIGDLEPLPNATRG
ncbi:MAG: di-trans,poly-cis-decaprenylcistransferase, partial [Coriobacteriales bacterium]|nr:di-trans,poly-cis-decaprenylcistransferase [Coriobacteriales bacterium]